MYSELGGCNKEVAILKMCLLCRGTTTCIQRFLCCYHIMLLVEIHLVLSVAATQIPLRKCFYWWSALEAFTNPQNNWTLDIFVAVSALRFHCWYQMEIHSIIICTCALYVLWLPGSRLRVSCRGVPLLTFCMHTFTESQCTRGYCIRGFDVGTN